MVMMLIGASHHDVPLDVLGRLAGSGDAVGRRLVASAEEIRGAVVLSTCNRYEVYLDVSRFHDAVDVTTAAIAEATGLDLDVVNDAMRVTVGTSVAQHLFSVASGLESMVVGEDEIAGQVKQALTTARSDGTTTPALERLLQRALATSKSVTRSTSLGAAGRSLVTVALDLVEARHGAVAGGSVLILGTGSYARVVVAAVERRGATDVRIHSSADRAHRFAESHGVTAIAPEQLGKALASADLVIACSGSTGPVIDAALLSAERSTHAMLPIIDLALTPDVAPDVRALPWVDLIDLAVIEENAPEEHATAILAAQDILFEAVESFDRLEAGRTADHAVVAMRAHVMAIINEEVERIRRRVDEDTAEEVARALTRVSNAILHTPSVRAHELARTGRAADYNQAIHTLFGIEVDLAPRD